METLVLDAPRVLATRRGTGARALESWHLLDAVVVGPRLTVRVEAPGAGTSRGLRPLGAWRARRLRRRARVDLERLRARLQGAP